MKKAVDKVHNIKKDKFVEFYASDEVRGNVSLTCSAVGISRSAYYKWLEEDEDFRAQIYEEKLKLCDDMEQVLIARAVDKSDTALIYWLKYNHEKYKEVGNNVNVQVNNFIPILGETAIDVPKDDSTK